MAFTAIATVGRCGSSYVAMCLDKLGVMVDPKRYWNIPIRAGYEHWRMTQVNNTLTQDLLKRGEMGVSPKDVAEVVLLRRGMMEEVSKGLVAVKDPRFCMTMAAWAVSGLISRVVVLQRDSIWAASNSTKTSGAGLAVNSTRAAALHGWLLWELRAHNIPHTIHVFPRFLVPGYGMSKLAEELASIAGKSKQEALKVMRELSKPERVTVFPQVTS